MPRKMRLWHQFSHLVLIKRVCRSWGDFGIEHFSPIRYKSIIDCVAWRLFPSPSKENKRVCKTASGTSLLQRAKLWCSHRSPVSATEFVYHCVILPWVRDSITGSTPGEETGSQVPHQERRLGGHLYLSIGVTFVDYKWKQNVMGHW